MTAIVADASALVEYLLQTDRAPEIRSVIEASGNDLHTPALCDIEVAAALGRAILQSRITPGRATDAVSDYLDLPLSRHGHQALLPRILQLRSNFSAYDAGYVALAEQLKGELLTADGSLALAVGRQVAIRLAIS